MVVVATPPARHASDALAALAAGAAVIVEKPLATTLAEADALVEAAAADGDRLGYAENLAFAPIVIRAVSMVRTLGPLRHVDARMLQGRPDWGDFLTEDWGGGRAVRPRCPSAGAGAAAGRRRARAAPTGWSRCAPTWRAPTTCAVDVYAEVA